MWSHLVRVGIAVVGLVLFCWPTSATAPTNKNIILRVLDGDANGLWVQPMRAPVLQLGVDVKQFTAKNPFPSKGDVLQCSARIKERVIVEVTPSIILRTLVLTCDGGVEWELGDIRLE